jgi:hypothetical protein
LRVKLLVLSILAITACKKTGFTPNHNAGYIVGPTNDIYNEGSEGAVAIKELSTQAVNGTVLIATRLSDKRVKFCSGSLIAGENNSDRYRVLTNHHCFAETGDDDKATRKTLPEACSQTKVYFGYFAGRTQDSVSLPCQAGTLRTNFEGDLAVFELAGVPPAIYKPLALWDGEEAPEGRPAAIVHYPDTEENMAVPPEGGPKLPTASVTVNDCRVLGLFAISEWDLDRTLPFSLRHSCDLIHGSSGSALIDVQTSTILGVNWGGIKISYEEGTRTDNVATRASYVAAFLNGTTDEAVKQAEGKRHDADVAAANKDENFGDKAKRAADSAKKSCGVVQGGVTTSLLLLVAGLALPFLSLRRMRKHDARR